MDKNEIKKDWASIEVMALSAHLPIDVKPVFSKNWVLNGINNSNWKMYHDAYEDSPTNSSIIDGTTTYIYGDGLIDINGDNELHKKTNISKHLSKKDARQICEDYKKYGAFAVQVIWNNADKDVDKKPLQIKYFKVFKLGLSIDEEMEVNGYWYSFDWSQQGKYPPVVYPKYDGKYKGNDVELIVFQRPSSNDFFSQPDYISGVRYAQLEGEIQNWAYNHVMNGFQGTKVVNCNNGVPPTEELKTQYKKEILSKLTGTNNANKVIVSFNSTPENGIVITDVPIVELNQQYVQFNTDSREQLITAHKADNFPFVKSEAGNGLSNNADEIEMQTAMMYRSRINPMREVILDSLMEIFVDIDPAIELGFKDFATFGGDKVEQVSTDNNVIKENIA